MTDQERSRHVVSCGRELRGYRVECHLAGCNWIAWYENESTAHREGQRHEVTATARGVVAYRQCVNPDCLAEEGDRHEADCTLDDASSQPTQ